MNRERWIRTFVERLKSLGTHAHPEVLEEIASDFFEVEGEQDPITAAQDAASDWAFPPVAEESAHGRLNDGPR